MLKEGFLKRFLQFFRIATLVAYTLFLVLIALRKHIIHTLSAVLKVMLLQEHLQRCALYLTPY